MFDFKRIINTVKYMTFRQWVYRIYYTFRNKLFKRKPKIVTIKEVELLRLNYDNKLENLIDINIANEILDNCFLTISNIKVQFDSKVDWDLPKEKYRLVCFKLNSFKWLLNLSDAYKATKDKKYILKGFALIDDWNNSNSKIIAGDKWNPYVIAERLTNTIAFCSEYCSEFDIDINEYSKYIYSQALELKKSIEYQLGANHLLSEAKALIISGVFLKDRGLYRYGKKVLKKEIYEQFLNDGAHYERSISYHVESLQQCFESLVVMNHISDSDVNDYLKLIKKPYIFLNDIISVNGEIPLFNDAALDYPFYEASDFLATSEMLFETIAPNSKKGAYFRRWNNKIFEKERIEWENKGYFSDSGYIHYKFKGGNESYSLYFDGGDCGPDYNLGHAHADALSILLANSKKNIFVDSGVYTYKPGDERNLCRSTRAHNTIELDCQNSAEIWSAFRVAKRGYSSMEINEFSNQKLHIIAQHNGYEKILKRDAIHKRELVVSDNRIYITDTISGKHIGVLRFHIGKECLISKVTNNTCIIDDSILIEISRPLNIVDCEIASCFGIKEKSKCIEAKIDTIEENKIITVIKFIK